MFKRHAPNRERTHEDRVNALIEKIRFLHTSKNDLGVKNLIKHQPINLLIEALEGLDNSDISIRFLVGAYKIKMGELFMAFGENMKMKVMDSMKSGIFAHLLEDLNSDDVYELYTAAPLHIQRKIIFNASKQLKEEIKQLKEFGFAEAGSIMNTTFATLLEDMKISEAINFVRRSHNEFDIGEEIFVVDANNKVVGKVNIKKLFLTYMDLNREEEADGMLSELVERSFMSAHEEEDIDEITDLFRRYNIRSLAILDREQQLMGIIDYQDIIPEILDSNIEDVYKFYGIRETRKSYLSSSIFEIVKSRIACLIIMLFAATLTTWFIDKFESWGVQYTAGISTAILVPIIPIITDMCGNTGSQTTATIIQAYSSGDLQARDFKFAIRKELKISVVIGAILAVCNMIRLSIYFALFRNVGEFKSKVHMDASTQDSMVPLLNGFLSGQHPTFNGKNVFGISMMGALASSLALWIVVIFSKFFGVVIPLVAIRFNQDPAAVSAPILTTILDTVASIIFFGIGVWVLHLSLSHIFGFTVQGGKITKAVAATIDLLPMGIF